MAKLSSVFLLTSFLAYLCKHTVTSHALEREAHPGPDWGDFLNDPCAGVSVGQRPFVALRQQLCLRQDHRASQGTSDLAMP